MKNAEDIDGAIGDQIGNSVVAIMKDANITFLFIPIFMAKMGKILQELYFIIDTGNDVRCRSRIVCGYIRVDFSQPTICLLRPSYFWFIRLKRTSFHEDQRSSI